MPEPPHLASSTAGVSALLRVLPERLTLSLRESPAAMTHCAFKPLRPQSFPMICRSCLIGDFLVKVTAELWDMRAGRTTITLIPACAEKFDAAGKLVYFADCLERKAAAQHV